MLLTPLRVAAALLALTAGTVWLPGSIPSAQAQDAVQDAVPDVVQDAVPDVVVDDLDAGAPAPIPLAEEGAPDELQTDGSVDGSVTTGDCQNGNCQGGNCQGGNCPGGQGYHGDGWYGNGQRVMGNPISSRDLFYNYYVGPAAVSNPYGANSVAAMYPSPVPVPALVGHTYITYQPLLPHEFLYEHNHNYYSQHPGGGQTTTRVRYRYSPLGALNPIFGNRAPRPRGVEYLENPLWR